MWKICGYQLEAGEKKQVFLTPNVADYQMPATLICGAGEGRTVVITASIHSGEYPGVPAVIRTARSVDPQKLRGNLLLVHCVNVSGFWARTNGRVPEDNGNLNGNYPGSPNGTVSERIADYFVREIFPQTDFLMDLHSGGQQEPLTPCLFYPKAQAVSGVSLEAARALDIRYLIASSATQGEYSYAANFMDIPGLLVERGHCGYCHEEWIQAYERDIQLLLDHLGSYPYEGDKTVCEKEIFENAIYLTAKESGLWYPAIKEGERVNRGQLLGRMEDFFGAPVREYYAQENGLVFYYTSGLAVKEGGALVAYGVL